MTNTIPSKSHQAGSIEYFRSEWVKQMDETSFIYPRKRPNSQWDVFEYHKLRAMENLINQLVPPNGSILEYGCGAAGILIALTNRGYQGTALDATYEALQIAKANDAREGDTDRTSQISFVEGNAFSMPFADASFDCVVSNGLLEHFSPEILPSLLEEVMRVLKPGGLFLADIVHRRASTRQAVMPVNFLVSYLAHKLRRESSSARHLWKTVSSPMYENSMTRKDWEKMLEAAGIRRVAVSSFRLPPPLSLPRFLDRAYGRLLASSRVFSWATALQSYNVPLGWVYLASGVKCHKK